MRVSLATDIGGGTSYSMLRTAAEGYKVLQLRGQTWPALDAFYALTLGNARALGLERRDRHARVRAAPRISWCSTRARPRPWRIAWSGSRAISPRTLFVLLIMGDERAVRATYVMGERVHGDAP